MSRRTQKEVRTDIENALLVLMETADSFSCITVTDIIKEAHVARACFYRNFESKEDVIRSYLLRMRTTFIQNYYLPSDYCDTLSAETVFVPYLQYCLANREQILLIYKNGLGELLLEEASYFTEERLGDMPYRSPDQYFLYVFSLGFLGALIHWLQEPAAKRKTPEEIANVFIRCYSVLQK